MGQTRLERFEHRTEWPLDAVESGLVALYAVFVVDYLARLYLADPRGRWFVRHLHDLAIVVLPFLRPLRLLSLAVVIEVLQRAVGHTIRGKVIVYTVCGAVV
jgi:voltage-gated potassium channel